ncbi:MAG: polyprenyl synthetase [Bacteroidetes bacterium HGW-Bacteroidetes-19]|nr:MAG: polyprenyl synthetase [Bacteroidetes bacterium HGW-Bacteroidetes-19]
MKFIEEHFKSLTKHKTPKNLYEPIGYILESGGKRVRPKLVELAIEIFNGDMSKAIYPAASFEMLHNFTLIHDDIMDLAPLRRGKETVYKKWNNNIAILSGDALATMALQQILLTPTDADTIVKMASLFGQTSLEICEGQQYDLDFESSDEVSIEKYIEMIRLKTAVMLAGCLKVGAILSHASSKDQDEIYNFGIHVGLAFQLKDDLFDVYSDEITFGKQIGGDIKSNKKTYLYLLALEKANMKQKEELTYWFTTPSTDFKTKFKQVKSIFDELNINVLTEDKIRYYVEKAVYNVNQLSVKEEYKKKLIEYAQQLAQRIK